MKSDNVPGPPVFTVLNGLRDRASRNLVGRPEEVPKRRTSQSPTENPLFADNDAKGVGGVGGVGGVSELLQDLDQAALDSMPWYRPDLDRNQAQALLSGTAQGMFCVRPSATQPGCFALSIAVPKLSHRVWHGLIRKHSTDGQRHTYAMDHDSAPRFASIVALIDHLRDRDIGTMMPPNPATIAAEPGAANPQLIGIQLQGPWPQQGQKQGREQVDALPLQIRDVARGASARSQLSSVSNYSGFGELFDGSSDDNDSACAGSNDTEYAVSCPAPDTRLRRRTDAASASSSVTSTSSTASSIDRQLGRTPSAMWAKLEPGLSQQTARSLIDKGFLNAEPPRSEAFSALCADAAASPAELDELVLIGDAETTALSDAETTALRQEVEQFKAEKYDAERRAIQAELKVAAAVAAQSKTEAQLARERQARLAAQKQLRVLERRRHAASLRAGKLVKDVAFLNAAAHVERKYTAATAANARAKEAVALEQRVAAEQARSDAMMLRATVACNPPLDCKPDSLVWECCTEGSTWCAYDDTVKLMLEKRHRDWFIPRFLRANATDPFAVVGGEGVSPAGVEVEAEEEEAASPQFAVGRHSYRVHFEQMEQENVATGFRRPVRRRPAGMSPARPDTWQPMCDPATPQLFELSSTTGSAEHGEVVAAFRNSWAGNLAVLARTKILRVARVQNTQLWELFSAKRHALLQRERATAGDVAAMLRRYERRWLFHGLEKGTVPKVMQQGFNRNFSGKNATRWGKGCYFGTDSSYSACAQFAVPDADGEQCMFLCRVLVGEYCLGAKDAKAPRIRKGQLLYDSTVNDTHAPSIFVTYHDAQVYPEYLVTFKTSG